jgi:hypothetical protein
LFGGCVKRIADFQLHPPGEFAALAGTGDHVNLCFSSNSIIGWGPRLCSVSFIVSSIKMSQEWTLIYTNCYFTMKSMKVF